MTPRARERQAKQEMWSKVLQRACEEAGLTDAAVGAYLGVSREVARRKLQSGALALDELETLIVQLGPAVLEPFLRRLQMRVVPAAPVTASPACLVKQGAEMAAAAGRLTEAYMDAVADGTVFPSEKQHVQEHVREVLTEVAESEAGVESVAIDNQTAMKL